MPDPDFIIEDRCATEYRVGFIREIKDLGLGI
jgi:hypothetical protein